MNKMTNGTRWRETPTGILAVRGKRELYLLGTSVAAMELARNLLAHVSFDRLCKAGFKCGAMKNTYAINVLAMAQKAWAA